MPCGAERVPTGAAIGRSGRSGICPTSTPSGGRRQPRTRSRVTGRRNRSGCSRSPIRNHTQPGDAVFDPFVGAGTAIIAAETTGRSCRALDIDPVYVQVAVSRWEAFTGESAVKIGGGR